LTIEEITAELVSSNKSLLSSRLAELSNLSSGELGLFEQAWAACDVKRRRQIVYRLVELAGDNLELNFDGIFKNCLKDQDANVRSEAIEGLWENEEASLIEPLIDLLQQDTSEKVQTAAAIALGKFAMLAEQGKLGNHHTARVSQALFTVIDDESKPVEVRRRALESASLLSLPEMKRTIMEAYENSDDKLRVSSIYAMGKSCDPSWLPILLNEMNNDDPEVRYEAVGACGELEEPEAVPHLIDLLNDPDTDVRLATIRALGKIGGAEAKRWLNQCLSSHSAAISQAAEQALEEMEAAGDPFSFKR